MIEKTDRIFWLEQTLDLCKMYRTVIIQGLRRIGKTIVMKSVSRDKYFFDYEKIFFQVGIFGQDDFIEAKNIINILKNNKNKKFLLQIDEFQDLKNWEKFLRTVYDLENAWIIATGSVSANKDLTNNTEGGRYSYIEMPPLSFEEFKVFYRKLNIENSQEKMFNIYATQGSYPDQEFSMSDINIYKKQVSENIVEKIENSSLVSKAKIGNIKDVKIVLMHIIENVGNPLNMHGISSQLGIHIETIKKIINYLKRTFIIYEVSNQRFSKGRAAAYNNMYYLRDHTFYLFNKSVNFKELDKIYQSFVFENIIFNSLKSSFSRYQIWIGFLKDKNYDIDLVIEKEGIKKYFEIKYSKIGSLSKNQKNFSKKNKLNVIYLGDTKVKNDIQYINYLEFMKGAKTWIENK